MYAWLYLYVFTFRVCGWVCIEGLKMDVQYIVCGGIDSIMVYGAICFECIVDNGFCFCFVDDFVFRENVVLFQ